MSLRYPVLMLLYSICSYYKWFEEERYLPRRGNPRSLVCKTALPYLWEWHPIYSVSHMHVCKVRGKGEIHVHSSSDLAAYHCVEPFHCKQMVLKNVTQAFHKVSPFCSYISEVSGQVSCSSGWHEILQGVLSPVSWQEWLYIKNELSNFHGHWCCKPSLMVRCYWS